MNETIWDFISDEAKDLIACLLQVDPLKRLSAFEALGHPWLNKFNPLGDNYSIFSNKAFSSKNYNTHNQQKNFTVKNEELVCNSITSINKNEKIEATNVNKYQSTRTNYFSVHNSFRFRSRSFNSGPNCVHKKI